jgi:prepilin-type N-terminal cleavage/methylation domain-containing protein
VTRPTKPRSEGGAGFQPALGGQDACPTRRAFTIIELLVVIAVLGILITLIVTIASRAQYNQRVQNTRATMKNVELAIEQFATENPLRLLYDGRSDRTFGPYPPYQVAGDVTQELPPTVAYLLDQARPPDRDRDGRLWHRLARDLGCPSDGVRNNYRDWVQMDEGSDFERANDDIRALAAYLAVFSPGAFAQIPPSALQPLVRDPVNLPVGEFVSTSGTARSGQTGDPNILTARRQILGIHDAWGVPLDYFLYVRIEFTSSGYRVMDRVPVLRSLGIEREAYNLLRKPGADPRPSDPRKWIFSREMPAPYAGFYEDSGQHNVNEFPGTTADGWVRAVATGPSRWEDKQSRNLANREDYDFTPRKGY